MVGWNGGVSCLPTEKTATSERWGWPPSAKPARRTGALSPPWCWPSQGGDQAQLPILIVIVVVITIVIVIIVVVVETGQATKAAAK